MSARVLFCCWPFEGHVFPFARVEPTWLAVRAREGKVSGRRQSLRVQRTPTVESAR